MKFTVIASALVLGSCVAAWPYECINQYQADKIVERFASVLGHKSTDWGNANQTAHRMLADEYREISDSILSLEHQPLGGVTFSGKAAWITGVLSAPPTKKIDTLEVLIAGCDRILWYWKFLDVGTGQYEVKGFNLFTITPEHQICQTHLEFNSVAWGQDIFQLPCGNSSSGNSSSGNLSSGNLSSGNLSSRA